MRPLTPSNGRSSCAAWIKVYTTFTRNVAAGRNLPLAKVLDIAQGRVWSGEDALGIGLIDTYGGLYAAIAIAADKAEFGRRLPRDRGIRRTHGSAAAVPVLRGTVALSFTRSGAGRCHADLRERIQGGRFSTRRGHVLPLPNGFGGAISYQVFKVKFSSQKTAVRRFSFFICCFRGTGETAVTAPVERLRRSSVGRERGRRNESSAASQPRCCKVRPRGRHLIRSPRWIT